MSDETEDKNRSKKEKSNVIKLRTNSPRERSEAAYALAILANLFTMIALLQWPSPWWIILGFLSICVVYGGGKT